MISGLKNFSKRCEGGVFLNSEVIDGLRAIVGEDWVIAEVEKILGYLLDETPESIRPEAVRDVVVVKPRSAGEVSKILKLANEFGIPVFPRGGGTGLVGGCIPTLSGIVLSLERMKNLVVDRDNLIAEAEAGVTLAELIEAAEKAGLFFPLHPGDEGAQIGGLIACNAGGVRAIKTGVMRNYVKGIEVVLPTGEIMTLGGKILKNNAGYDLMHLIIGSEGTLGVITKAWIKLEPKPRASATIIIPFDDRRKALKAVPEMFREGIIPIAVEYIERRLADRAAEELGMTWPCREGEYHLMVILTESSEDELFSKCEKLLKLCERIGALEPILAERREDQERILRIRSGLHLAVEKGLVDILDVTVPPARMVELIEAVEELARRRGTDLPVFGHAGDGNLHIHLMEQEGWGEEDYEELRNEIYRKAIELGGTITGEHGIGYTRRKSFEKFIDKKALELMRRIKKIFDPNNILNPDKIFL